MPMNVEKLEEAVTDLSPDELDSFAIWFEKYLAEQWDQKIESDAKAGRLDHLIEKAHRDDEKGRTQPL